MHPDRVRSGFVLCRDGGDRQQVFAEWPAEGVEVDVRVDFDVRIAVDVVRDPDQRVGDLAQLVEQLGMPLQGEALVSPTGDPIIHGRAPGQVGRRPSRGEAFRGDAVDDPVEWRGRGVRACLADTAEPADPALEFRDAEKPQVPLHGFQHLDQRGEVGVVPA